MLNGPITMEYHNSFAAGKCLNGGGTFRQHSFHGASILLIFLSHIVRWGPQSDTDSVLLHNLLQSSSLRNLKVALLYESQGLIARLDDNKTIPFDDHSAEKLKQHVGYMAEQYFHHPNYLKVDGKPVIYFYLSRVFSGIYKEAFANMRLVLRQKYGYELYLVGDEVYWGGVPDLQRIQTWDAITSYNMHGIARHAGYPGDTNYLQDVQQRFTEFQSTTDSLGLDFVPQIAPAFNDRGVRLQANHYAIPHEMRAELAGSGQFTTFWESLNMAQRVLKQSNRTTSNTIVVTSWNEWHEDSSIEPTAVGAPSTNKPNLYTENYTYEAFGFKLLEMVQRFHNQSLRQENFKSKELSDSTTLLEN